MIENPVVNALFWVAAVAALPFVAYFVCSFAAVGWYRGRDSYRKMRGPLKRKTQ